MTDKPKRKRRPQKQALTAKQEMFCIKVVEGLGISDAYRFAYNTDNQKMATTNRAAKTLIDLPKITARVAELRAPIIKKAQLSAQFVHDRLAEIANLDVRDILNDDWCLRPLSEWPDAWCRYLSSFDVQQVRAGQSDPDAAAAFITKLKWPDKVKNLELIGKLATVQAFKDNVSVAADVKITKIVREIIDPKKDA